MRVVQTDTVAKIYSTLIDEFVDNFPSPAFTLTLGRDANCASPSLQEIEPADVKSEMVRIDCGPLQAAYFIEVTLGLGPHSLTLTKNDESTITTEEYCHVNLNGLECDVVDAYVGGNEEAWLLFEALRSAQECTLCVCDKLCVIYTRLQEILNGSTNC
jgi:hypothetical protein